MHELLLGSVWNWLNMPTVLNMAKYAMGSEYVFIFMNMSNSARILNIPESVKIYPNVDKYTSICLTLCDWIYLKYNVPK